jgi:hypothetical protein
MLKRLLLGLFLLFPGTVTLANGIVGALVVVVTEVESYGSQKVYFVTAPADEIYSLARKISPEKNIVRLVIEGKNYYAFTAFNTKDGAIEGRFFGSTALVKIVPPDYRKHY